MEKEKALAQYRERFQDDFSIRRKVTQTDEKSSFHIHDEFELLFVLSDGIQCTVSGKTYFLSPNTLLLFNDMDLHHIAMTRPGINDRYVVYFKPEYAASLSTPETDLLECFFFRPFPNTNILPLTEEEAAQLLPLLSKLDALNHFQSHSTETSGRYGNDLRIRLLLAQLLLQVNDLYRQRHGIKEGAINPRATTIYNIMSYLHKNYWQEVSLDLLAAQFFMNKYSMCALFKSVTGTSINQYLIHCRLMKAKELLLNRESVENVCARVGYNNLSHFSRIFKQHTGQSPKQYQKAHT